MENEKKNSSIKFNSKEENNKLDEELCLFQSEVANALLDFIEDKDDAEIVNRLTETKQFFVKLSEEIDRSLPQKNITAYIKNEDFECAEDILKCDNFYLESSLIH